MFCTILSRVLFRGFMKITTMLQLKPNTDWVTIFKILLYTAVSQIEPKRPMSGEYGPTPVPEYEAGAEDNQSSEIPLTVGTLYVHCKK